MEHYTFWLLPWTSRLGDVNESVYILKKKAKKKKKGLGQGDREGERRPCGVVYSKHATK